MSTKNKKTTKTKSPSLKNQLKTLNEELENEKDNLKIFEKELQKRD
jgi:hypothetical protein